MNPLNDRTFARLFAAQVSSLLGTGLMTVGLALLALRIGGVGEAGLVLSGVLTVKMIAYVGFAPIANAILGRLPARPLLVGLDVARLVLVALMPLLSEVWQIYAIVFLFQLCSAAFTPAFQSLVPEILPDERRYARALALSRLAYNAETMASPLLAGLLLGIFEVRELFGWAAAGFAISALTVMSAGRLTRGGPALDEPLAARLTRGFGIFMHTPRLCGLLAANFALSLSLAWVLVNTVVHAGLHYADADATFTRLMTVFGLGSIVAALTVPFLVERMNERALVLFGAAMMGTLAIACALLPIREADPLFWLGFGVASSFVLTPGGLVLARSARSAHRPALFAAQFSLSHAGWLLAYPLAGWLATSTEPAVALGLLGFGTLVVGGFAARWWPRNDPLERRHTHAKGGHAPGEPTGAPVTHIHPFHIDDDHPRWGMASDV